MTYSQLTPSSPWIVTQLPRLLSSATCEFHLIHSSYRFTDGNPHSKRDSAVLAQEQSAHLYLCVLIADLTQRYGPVVRQAKVVGVLDAAFDVLVPEFGIEKRVHVDQMPIDVRISRLSVSRVVTNLQF